MSAQPVIAVSAASQVLADYVADVVRLAGFEVASGKNAPDLALLCGKDAKIRPDLEKDRHIELDFTHLIPMKAANLADFIKKQVKSALSPEDRIEIGGGTLDMRESLWLSGNGEAVRLTDKEAGILSCLAQAKGAAVGRQELLDRVWAYAEGVETHTLETHIYRLRQKIEPDPANPVVLLTAEQGYSVPVRS